MERTDEAGPNVEAARQRRNAPAARSRVSSVWIRSGASSSAEETRCPPMPASMIKGFARGELVEPRARPSTGSGRAYVEGSRSSRECGEAQGGRPARERGRAFDARDAAGD